MEVITHDQSGDIAGAVAQETQMGAGDQGIVYGFACSETAELLPLPVALAHRLTLLLTNARKTGTIQGLGPDGKAQVSVEYQSGKPCRIATVVVSCQHDADKDMDELRREITRHVIVPALRELYPDHKTEVFINPSGRFVLGGFEADTGLTGRKLMADTYGGLAPHGGGALSGKDGSKVDRSGAYMARYIAKNIVAAGLAEKCTISLAYAIGRAEPVAVDIDAHQTGKYPEAVLEQASADKSPIEGAQFKLTYADGKVVDAASGQLSSNGLYTSNKEGQIVLSGITGTIVCTEVSSAPGFAIDPNTRTQTIVVNPDGDTQHLYVYNTPLCSLTLSKVDSVTGKPIPNTTFTVKYASGELIGRYTTGRDGTVTVSGLLPGSTVVVSEYKVPDPHVLNTTPQTITLKSGANTVTSGGTGAVTPGTNTGTGGGNGLDFENDPKMTLTIRKYIKGTNREPLAGVCFKVTEGSGTPVGPGDGTFYTNSAGEIVIEGLEPGTTVTAREIATVEGFVLDGEPKTIKIKAGKEAPELIFWNEKAGSLVIQKKDKISGKPLANVQFQLTYADGSYVDYDNGHLSSKGLYQTDANGEIRISGVVGTIVAKEVRSIPGYSIDPATQTQSVQVNPGDTQYLVFYNAPAGNFELIKVVEGNEEKRIPNVTFEIRRAGDGGLVDTITTGSDGRATLQLDAGNYYAVETGCPKEFKLDPTPHYFTMKDGENTTLSVKNKAFSGIQIRKTDSVTGKGIYGVSFILYDSTNKPIGQYTSDDRGYVYIEGLTDGGRYYLRELDNEGYVPDTQMKTVYVKAREVTLVEWQNTPITGQIQISKTSADYNPMNGWPAGTPIPGTEFEIYHYRTGNLVDTVRTDKNGVAVSKPLPLGRYKVVESKAAAFYGLDKTPIEAELEHAGQIVKVAMTNKALSTNVSIKKTGYAEVMPGQDIRYTFSEIGNNSTTALTSFYWRDTLPVQAVRLNRIFTGTYNAPGNYKVVYKTNLSGEYRTMYDNLSTSKNYTLDASPVALGLASNEYVTEFMLVFGVVPANFRQVEAPKVDCKVLSTVKGGSSFTNAADVGGVYNGQWIQAVTRWTTKVYGKPVVPSLPKTGY